MIPYPRQKRALAGQAQAHTTWRGPASGSAQQLQMRLSAGGLTRVATLSSKATARAIWDALLLETRANRSGDGLYFPVPSH